MSSRHQSLAGLAASAVRCLYSEPLLIASLAAPHRPYLCCLHHHYHLLLLLLLLLVLVVVVVVAAAVVVVVAFVSLAVWP